MIKFFRFVGVLSLSCLIVGCPLVSEYPLTSNMSVPINPKLVGTWIQEGNTTDTKSLSISIFAFNQQEYYMEVRDNNNIEDVMRLRAFISTIDNVPFLNFKDITGCYKGYRYFKYILSSDNVLNLRIIDDELIPARPSTQEGLLSDIRRYINNDNLYTVPIKFIRIDKSQNCR